MNSSTTLHHFSRRSATEDDLPFLVELRQMAMHPHHLLAGIVQSDEEAMARVRAFWGATDVVEAGGRRIGMIKVVDEGGSLRIVQLQLMPGHQRRGIGTRLVRDVLHQARLQGKKVGLSVLKVNPARRLYERLGFRVVGEDELSDHMLCDT